VASGLIGDSLSGVTYISVPGQVGTLRCGYLQVVLGYALGYLIVARVLLSVVLLARALDLGPLALAERLVMSPQWQVFFWDWRAPEFFWKQFLSGAALAVVMTGLDQNHMQKTLSCRSLPEAQRNVYSFAGIMIVVNAAFLALGVLLWEFAGVRGVSAPAMSDHLFPQVALQSFGSVAALVFILSLTAATFNSADSVLTTLTTRFCIDFLRFERRTNRKGGPRDRSSICHSVQSKQQRFVQLSFPCRCDLLANDARRWAA